MSKRLTVIAARIAIATLLATSGLGAQSLVTIPPKAPFDRLYQDYAAGNFDVITHSVTSARALAQLLAPPDAAKLRKWLGKWDRRRAVFILEFAEAEAQFAPGAAITAISEGRLFVIGRPTPLGQSPEDDAFELAWHKAAMSMLEDRMFVSTQELYLDTIERRYTPAPGAPAVRFDPRFALHRAVAQEQKCWNDRSQMTGDVTVLGNPQPVDTRQLAPGPSVPTEIATRKNCLTEGVRRYVMASASPATAVEAFTRGAWMQYQLGAYPDALRTIDRAVPTEDAELTYWTQLFRGRILDGLERFADAERAYRAALAVRPAAQSAGVGLALTLFKLDRVPDARAAAIAARRQPPDTVDPWWTYLGADARFSQRWRTELRLSLGQK